MRINHVLVDFESVQPKSIAALKGDHFRLMLFVGASQTKLPLELVAEMQRMGDKAQYVQISGNGRNALDFHIAFYVGQLAAVDPTAFFHIIAKDKGYDPLVHHLKTRDIFSSRVASIEDIPAVKLGSMKSSEERAKAFMERLVQSGATKPRTEKTLTSAISSFFHKQLADDEVAEVIDAMEAAGFLVTSENKIAYSHRES